MSQIQIKGGSVDAVVSAIRTNDKQTLLDIFFEKKAQVEILECNHPIDDRTCGGWHCCSFLGVEKRGNDMPAEYFAFVALTTHHQDCGGGKAEPILISLWAQEYQPNEYKIREQYILEEVVGKENSTSSFRQVNPCYDRSYDHHFVFHALSRLRSQLDQLPQSIRVYDVDR